MVSGVGAGLPALRWGPRRCGTLIAWCRMRCGQACAYRVVPDSVRASPCLPGQARRVQSLIACVRWKEVCGGLPCDWSPVAGSRLARHRDRIARSSGAGAL